jgi:pyruvate,water dikinase
MLNIGEPSQAFSLSTLPVQGVGLARLEFIIANHIKIHPMALIYFSKVKDKSQKKKIEKLTRMYPADCKEDFFVDTLASGVSVICAAFWPKPVC